MKTVYRLETESGEGFYISGYAGIAVYETGYSLYDDTKRHPNVEMDSTLDCFFSAMNHRKDKWFFGFANLAQYIKWIYKPALRNSFTEHGLQLNLYRVSNADFFMSSYQAVFVLENAKLIDSFSPNNYKESRL